MNPLLGFVSCVALTRLRKAQPPSPASQEKACSLATKVAFWRILLLRSGRGWLSFAKPGEGNTTNKAQQTPRGLSCFAPFFMSDSTSRPFWSSPLAFLSLFGLCALTVLFRLGDYGLIDADEGRYASIPREMLARGDWITPTLNGAKFFDKPPLLYWGEMLAFKLFGSTEFAARFAPALFALASIVAIYGFCRRTFGARAAFLSAAILSTTLMWPVLGRTVFTDTPLASCTTLALCAWWLGHTETGSRKNLWFALFWICLGLGVLSKGPVAVLLCFGAIVPYLLWCRPQNGWKMGALWGVPLMLLVAAPWFVLVQLRNPEFGRLFWWEQNFARFMGSEGVPDHWEAPWYFLPFLPLVFFPWSVFMVRALGKVAPIFRRARTDSLDERARAVVFLVFGSLFVLLFFSISKSKIVSYIAPLVPLGCALLGAFLDSRWNKKHFQIEAVVLSILTLVGGIAAFVFAGRAPEKLGLESATLWLCVLGAVLIVWSLALTLCVLIKQTKGIFGATAGGFALFLATAISFWCVLAPTMTTEPLVARVRPAFTSDTRIASVGFIQSLSFYTQRRVAVDGVVGGRDGTDESKIPDELLPAWKSMSQTERDEYFYGDREGLERLLARPQTVFVFARSSRLKGDWGKLGANAHVLLANKRYTVIGNAAARERFEALALTPR